jgi:hypothetical protein
MSGRAWSVFEEVVLWELYPDTPTAEIARLLRRTDRQVYSKADTLGLKKSAAYLAGPHACRLRRGDNPGKGTRFQKGQTPWNAGLKGWAAGGRSVETRFKPGEISGRAAELLQPLGAERLNKDGIVQRKIREDGPAQRRWKAVHALLWEEQHGRIPRGHIVVFKNGDKTDIRLDNLELISRAENMRRNTVHRLPKELAEVVQLKGALQRQINKRMAG